MLGREMQHQIGGKVRRDAQGSAGLEKNCARLTVVAGPETVNVCAGRLWLRTGAGPLCAQTRPVPAAIAHSRRKLWGVKRRRMGGETEIHRSPPWRARPSFLHKDRQRILRWSGLT